jgi:hypothetical protein
MARRVLPFGAVIMAGLAIAMPFDNWGRTGAASGERGQAARPQAAGSAVVAGQVVDATTGRPIGAVVTLALGAPPAASASGQQPAPPAQSRRGVAVAAADGRFVFRDVPAGTFSLTATLAGYAPGASGRRRPGGPGRPFTVADGARVTDAVITMWRLAAISGTVRDDRGEPAVGVAVWALRRTTAGGRLELTLTGGTVESADERGQYRLSNLMPGSYVVSVRLSTQSAAVSTVDAYREAVTSGTTAEIMRGWSETGALSMATAGLVVDDWQVSTSLGMPQPLPGPGGTLLIHPTVYHPQATSTGDATVLTLGSGDERLGIDLTLPLVAGVRVSGTLQGPDGPAANHGLRLHPVHTGGPASDVPAAYATTDAAGRFALLGVPPGTYVLRAYRVPPRGPMVRPVPRAAGGLPFEAVEVVSPPEVPDGAALFADVPVTVGSSHLDDLSVVLQQGARLSGRVAFDGATPPPPAERLQQISLSIRPLAGSLPLSDAPVDAEGRFTTSGYPPGRYVLNVRPPGPEWAPISVRVAGADVAGQAFDIGATDIGDVVVTFSDRVMTLSGTVRAADPNAAPDATVIAFPADTRAWLESGMPPGRVATAATSATGEYQLRIPLPGDYLVVAVPPEIAPDVDPEFVARFAAAAVRVSFADGDARSQSLTVSRPR